MLRLRIYRHGCCGTRLVKFHCACANFIFSFSSLFSTSQHFYFIITSLICTTSSCWTLKSIDVIFSTKNSFSSHWKDILNIGFLPPWNYGIQHRRPKTVQFLYSAQWDCMMQYIYAASCSPTERYIKTGLFWATVVYSRLGSIVASIVSVIAVPGQRNQV